KLVAGEEDRDVVATEPRLNLADSLEVYDRGLVNSGELSGIELVGDRLETGAQPVLRSLHVEHHVVPVGVDPIDVLRSNRNRSIGVPHDEARERARSRRSRTADRGEQLAQLGRRVTAGVGRSGAPDRFVEPGIVEWLEQVVERPNLE